MRDDFGMYSGIAVSVQETGAFGGLAGIDFSKLPKLPLMPVAAHGVPFVSYHSAVSQWANTYGPMSKVPESIADEGEGVEFGAIIYRADYDTFPPLYFMGETYKGFQPNDQWYTVVNGLIAGVARGLAGSFGTRLRGHAGTLADDHAATFRGYRETVNISIIGFAHTHPMGRGNSSAPSDPDRTMRGAGNAFGVDVFPIVWCDGEHPRPEINYEWSTVPEGTE